MGSAAAPASPFPSRSPQGDNVGGEPPREPLGGIRMARRRGQQLGYVHRQGNAWYLAYREDALDADGKIIRVRRHQKIASAKEATKREAQRIARQILGVVDERAQRPMSLVTVQDYIDTRFKTDVIWALKHAGQIAVGFRIVGLQLDSRAVFANRIV